MAFTIQVAPTTAALTIGDDYKKTNRIVFSVSLQGDETVWITLEIPLGESGVLSGAEDANDVEVLVGGKPMPRGEGKNPKDWWLADADKGLQINLATATKLDVSINNVLCRASEGQSKVTVLVSGASGNGPPKEIAVTKAKPTPSQNQGKNPILYFIAEPSYLIGKGDVTLRWEVAGDVQPTLDTERETGRRTKSPAIDSPSKTWTYDLRVGNEKRQATVNVLSEDKWYSLAPFGDHAFPSVIFDPGESTSAKGLHAIFVRATSNGGRKAVLCRSENGITNWEVIDDQVPEGMESSAGVRLKNRLWLIGGSTVDPARISNRIVYYSLDDKPTPSRARRSWQEASVSDAAGTSAQRFQDSARMGHACVVVDDKTIWMLGGMDKYHSTLDDIWSLEIANDGKLTAKPVTMAKRFTPRCMFGATTFSNLIWVCGGVSSPNGNPLNDIWATPLPVTANLTWTPRPKSKEGEAAGAEYIAENAIGTGAAACDGNLNVIVTKRTGGPAWQITGAMRTLAKGGITETTDTWPTAEPPLLSTKMRGGWTSTPHSVAAVSVSSRIYLRYLHRNALHGDLDGWPLFVRV
jgi:hypothetical protein